MGHPDPGLMADAGLDRDRRAPLLRAHHAVDPDYVSAFAENAGPTLRWLEGHGVRFDFLPTLFLTTSTTRMAPVGGGLAIVETMGKARSTRGGVPLRDHRPLAGLDDSGWSPGSRPSRRRAPGHLHRAVVLACGGYQGNAELMARYHGAAGISPPRWRAVATTTRARASRWPSPSAPPRPATSRCSTPSPSTRAPASRRPRSSPSLTASSSTSTASGSSTRPAAPSTPGTSGPPATSRPSPAASPG